MQKDGCVKMCDFCENSKQIIQETNMSSIRFETYSVCIMKNELVFAGTVQDNFGITFPAETAKIRFCPICGRKLEEEKELPWVTVGNWKPVEAKEIGKPQEKIEVANFESDWRKNAVYLEDDCK